MTETLFPGFREAVGFVFPPNSRIKVGKSFDIIHTVIEIVHAFDKMNPSTASEKYFGFRRIRINDIQTPLSSSQRITTVLEAVVIPYLLSRSPESDWEQKVVRIFKLFRALLATAYLLGITDTVSPLQYLMGIRIARSVPTMNSKQRVPLPQKFFSFLVWSLIYGTQLAQWYYSHESVLESSRSRLACSPPTLRRVGLPADPSLCGICFKTRANPTVLVTTGHVFCYSCIWKWLSEKGAVCPVSGRALPPVSHQLHYIRRLV